MLGELRNAFGVGAIVKKRFLLFAGTAMGILCFGRTSSYGQTNWTLTMAPSNAWVAVAASADCSTIAAVIAGGGIYNSLDSGTNWNQSDAPTNNWSAIASSTNGVNMTAAVNGGGIWRSSDSGASWLQSMAPSNSWLSLASSADGTRLIAGGVGGAWISTDSGSNWNLASPTGTNWAGEGLSFFTVVSSANGSMLFTESEGPGGSTWASTNAGSTWIDEDGTSFQSLALSANGSTMVAGAGNGVWVSTDLGESWRTWTLYLPDYTQAGAVASSADGSKLIVLEGSSPIYASGDGGFAWAPDYSPNEPLSNLALSADGNQLVAIVNGGGIYTWRPTAPFVASEPQSQTVPGETSVELNVGAFTIASPQFQWMFNGAPLQNATNSTLTLTSVTPFQDGSYSVLVSNAFGSVLSSNAVLTVVPAFLTTQTPDPSLHSANLIASITTGADSTEVWFEWGLDTNYAHATLPTLVQGPNTWSISNLITSLTPYTVYHCQAVASNEFGTVLGGDVSFTTVPKFVQVGTNTDWEALAMSADGLEIVGTLNGMIYVSTNLGATFTPTDGPGSVIEVSSNGETILSLTGTNLYFSLDRGETWSTNTTPTTFQFFAASSNAQFLAAANGNPNVWITTNFGATWTEHGVPYGYTAGLACSSDGSHIYGAGSAGYGVAGVYGSTDFGMYWNSVETYYGQTGAGPIACSSNGEVIAEAAEIFFMTANGGASWFLAGGGINTCGGVDCSASGETIILTAYCADILVSPDTGNSWYAANTPHGFDGVGVKSSADGKTLAIFSDGSLFLSLPPPSLPSALSVATISSNGLPTFELSGQPGYTYTVQASTNLINWEYVATFINTNGTVPFTDPDSPNYSQRYYRVVLAP
jgi:hypothetical protein